MEASTTMESPSRLAFSLPFDPARLYRARLRIRDYLHGHGVAEQAVEDVVLSLEEAMTNAMLHSGAADDLEVGLWFRGADVMVEVVDHGQGFDVETFDPGRVPDPLKPGGRGLFIISRLMDELELSSSPGLRVRAAKHEVLDQDRQQPAGRESDLLPGDLDYRDKRRRALLEEIDEAFVAVDWEYRVVFLNEAAARFIGPPEQLLGRPLWQTGGSADPVITAAVREAMQLGRSAVVEHELPGAPGRWLESRVYPTTSGVSVFIRDVTGRKLTEEQLRQSEARYRLVTENISDVIFLLDVEEDRFLYISPSVERLRGYTPAEVLLQSGMDALAPASQEYIRRVMPGRLAEFNAGIVRSHVDRIEQTTVWGRTVWTETTTRYARNEKTGHVEVFGASRDITRRLEIESELVRTIDERSGVLDELESERERLRAVLATMQESIDIWSADGRLLEVNEAGMRMHGCSSREEVLRLLSGPDSVVMRELDGSRVRPEDMPATRALRGERFSDWELRVEVPATGVSFVGSYTGAAVLDREGEVTLGVVTARDITATYEARQAVARELVTSRLLLDAAHRFSQSLDMSGVLHAFAGVIAEATGKTRAVLAVRDAERDELVVFGGEGGDVMPAGTRIAVRSLPAGVRLALTEGRPVAVDYEEPGVPKESRARAQAMGTRLALHVPLVVGEEVVSLIRLDRPGERREFTAGELRLVEGIAAQAAIAFERAQLYEAERDIASQLQRSFLHPLPDLARLEVGLVEAPASEPGLIGGDFWDVFELSDGRVVAIVGDVAGKGIPAAGLTETVRSTMRAFAEVSGSPAFILDRTNQLLPERSAEDLFVTALVLVIDTVQGRVRLASAGHPPPLHLSAWSCSAVAVPFGPPLGTFPAEYDAAQELVEPGDSLVLYTDGVTEARRGRELFGEGRLCRSLGEMYQRPAQETAAALRDAAEAFGGPLRDDLEVLVLKLKGQS